MNMVQTTKISKHLPVLDNMYDSSSLPIIPLTLFNSSCLVDKIDLDNQS